jgi:hypothetical protein
MGATSAASLIEPLKMRKSLHPHTMRNLTQATIVGGGRKRRASGSTSSVSTASAGLRLRVSLGAMTMHTTSLGSAVYLLNKVTIARPKGTLMVATVDPLLNPGTGYLSFGGTRVIRGDLFPLWMVVEGQRLGLLTGTLEIKGTDPVSGTLYQFTKSVTLAAPTDVNANVERVSARVQIEPIDTNAMPDREIELRYAFRLTDGNGRVYTPETGFFTVYPAI